MARRSADRRPAAGPKAVRRPASRQPIARRPGRPVAAAWRLTETRQPIAARRQTARLLAVLQRTGWQPVARRPAARRRAGGQEAAWRPTTRRPTTRRPGARLRVPQRVLVWAQPPRAGPCGIFRRLLLGGPTGGAVVVFVPGSPGTVAAVVASAPAPSSPAAAALARRLLEPRAARRWRRRRGWRGGCWWRRTTAASRPAGAGGRASRSGTRGSTSAPRPGSTPNQLEAERHYRKSSWSSGMRARGADSSRPRVPGRGPGACVPGR